MKVTNLSRGALWVIVPGVLVAATDPPQGPTAAVSLNSEPAYQTMKPCAAGCLIYQGPYYCGLRDYYDLAIALKCGCTTQNFCFCDQNTKSQASASSYISSCVANGCGTELPEQVTSAFDVYNGYCATANINPATTSATKTSVGGTSTTAVGLGRTSTPSGSSAAVQTLSSETKGSGSGQGAVQTSQSETQEKKGLSSSDVIALGVGIGVGVPSLLLALGTFCMQRRNRKVKEAASDGQYVR